MDLAIAEVLSRISASRGGRQFLRESLANSQQNALLEISGFPRPPGQRVATPGPQGQLDRTYHTRGTSNAAALASRGANFLHDIIVELRNQNGANIPLEYDSVLIKALLVHGADWAENKLLYESILKNPSEQQDIQRLRRQILRVRVGQYSQSHFLHGAACLLIGLWTT